MADILIGIDPAVLEAQLQQIAVETDLVLDDVHKTNQEADLVKAKVGQLTVESTLAFKKILQGARRTLGIIRGFAALSGDILTETVALTYEAALLTAELLFDIATAEAAVSLAGAATYGVKIALIASMLAKAKALKDGDTESAIEFQGLINISTALSYQIQVNPGGVILAVAWILKLLGG